MKNNLLKYYIASFYLASTFILFAQETPGTNDEGGSMEGGEVAAPIDGYVWVLALVGLVPVFMKFRAMHKNKIQG
jgi:hypothetical protein